MRIRHAMAAVVLGAIAMTSGSAIGHQTIGEGPGGEACGDPANMVVVVTDQDPDGNAGTEVMYIDARAIQSNGYLYSIWIYLESNDDPGVQTDLEQISAVTGDPADKDNCATPGHKGMDPDTLIF